MEIINKCPVCGKDVDIVEYPSYYVFCEISCPCGLKVEGNDQDTITKIWNGLSYSKNGDIYGKKNNI